MNLVNELQVSAEADDVLTVLRKTKRLASKLGRQDINEWLQAEQHGYAKEQEVPSYREIGTTIAMSTNGYIPAGYGMVMEGIRELPGAAKTVPVSLRDEISTVLALIESEKTGHGIYYPIPENTEYCQYVRSRIRCNPMIANQVSFMLRLDPTRIKAIPERIKDKVLEWACDLEAAGVTGDGLSFTDKEKAIAHNITFNIHDSKIGQLNNMGTNHIAR